MKLAIISPSYIDSWKRLTFAKRAYDSLLNYGGSAYTIIVVDDTPIFLGPLGLIRKLFLSSAGQKLYNNKNTKIYHHDQPQGSSNALLTAAKTSKKMRHDLVFIHLDDHIYLPILNELLNSSLEAFDHDPDLQAIRLTARPILSHLCDPKKGNTTFLNVSKDIISFEQVNLKPTRFDKFTLWSTWLKPETIQNYFAIAMWFTVYRTDYLIKILEFPERKKVKTLGKVELYYQNKSNWKKFIKENPGKLGYINMQFAGFETHRNKNWKQLINYPNIEVR